MNIQARERVAIFGRGTSGIYSIFPAIMKQVKPIMNINAVLGTIKVGGIDIAHIGKKYII